MLEGVLEARVQEAVVERLQAMGYVTLLAEEATAAVNAHRANGNATPARLGLLKGPPVLCPVDSVDNHNCLETALIETRSPPTQRMQRTEENYDPALLTAWY